MPIIDIAADSPLRVTVHEVRVDGGHRIVINVEPPENQAPIVSSNHQALDLRKEETIVVKPYGEPAEEELKEVWWREALEHAAHKGMSVSALAILMEVSDLTVMMWATRLGFPLPQAPVTAPQAAAAPEVAQPPKTFRTPEQVWKELFTGVLSPDDVLGDIALNEIVPYVQFISSKAKKDFPGRPLTHVVAKRMLCWLYRHDVTVSVMASLFNIETTAVAAFFAYRQVSTKVGMRNLKLQA